MNLARPFAASLAPGSVLSQLLAETLDAEDAQPEQLHDALQSCAELLAGPSETLAQMAQQRHVAPQHAGAPRSEAKAQEQVKSAFEQEFAAKAANKQDFDKFMQQVFGDKYDKHLAEQYRQQALAGDFSFLPKVQFVDADVLGGANGAYNADEGVVYINRDLAAADPATAAQTFVEEAGHHLDAKLNTVDTAGDEGEMFRRVLGGEQLSAQQVAEIRNDDDRGTITVNGKQVQVEFWNPFKAIGDAAKAVGNAISDGAKAVGSAIVDGAKAVGNAVADVAKGVGRGIKEVGEGIWGGIQDVGLGLFDGVTGFFGNLFRGNIGEAFGAVVRGLDRAIFQSSERFVLGLMEGAHEVVNGVTDALGPLGKPLRWVTDRAFDIGRTVFDTAYTLGRGAWRLLPDLAIGFVGDVERSIKLAADGRWGDAFEQFGMAFVNVPKDLIGNVVDMGAIALQAVASVGQTAIGLEPPARKLSDDEIDYLKTIYGDSIDYGLIRVKPGGALNDAMAAHTVGNTVYLPDDPQFFNPDGTLTAEGLATLGHEVGHVWQNQNGGPDYIHDALGANLWAQITTGDRDNAYLWRNALAGGESFESMNDEERAAVMEDIGRALRDDGSITASDGIGTNYSAAELAFLEATRDEIQHGGGAG